MRLNNPFTNKEFSIKDEVDTQWDGDILIIETQPGQEIWLTP